MNIQFCFYEQALRNPNLYIVTIINVIMSSVSNLYLYCFAGAVVTDNCRFSDDLFYSNWIEMPNSLQKFYIIMIAEAQRSMYLEGYGLIRLSMESFGKVLHFDGK